MVVAARRMVPEVTGLVIFLALLMSACAAPAPAAPPTTAPQTAPAANTWPEQRQFDQTVLPAARKEGEFTWYTSVVVDEAEPRIKEFNKYFPDIKVNYIYLQSSEGIQKITAEAQAGRMTADLYQAGGQSSRQIVWNKAASEEDWTPPALQEPGVEWNWQVLDNVGNLPVSHVNLGGLYINTNLVPRDKYPKTWKEMVSDSWWFDNIKAGKVVMDDPRRTGAANYYMYAFRELYAADYGEPFLQQLAGAKIKRVVGYAGEVFRGEQMARMFTNPSSTLKEIDGGGPVAMLCPDPGCNLTLYSWVRTKGAPHPNAAKVFINFWFTKEGQTFLSNYALSPARKGIALPDKYAAIDFAKQKYTFWPDDKNEEGNKRALDWVAQTRLFDY